MPPLGAAPKRTCLTPAAVLAAAAGGESLGSASSDVLRTETSFSIRLVAMMVRVTFRSRRSFGAWPRRSRRTAAARTLSCEVRSGGGELLALQRERLLLHGRECRRAVHWRRGGEGVQM